MSADKFKYVTATPEQCILMAEWWLGSDLGYADDDSCYISDDDLAGGSSATIHEAVQVTIGSSLYQYNEARSYACLFLAEARRDGI